ncbi:DUF2059 domain-containing protein [Campylobacter sp. US33a]|uniref:DUF2059 domain-containing protein n=1 Tax=Campylobacter sp. CCS1377 TaxID=3158229 RepID=A0AAU7E5Y8_9BACT|nr:DUF2059 domain-containing protein [Campylobacter sp. US33a]MCW1359842.1 DUF2059 domain-containing protein [Campylobacter jejuni]TEY03105.1 DUF2059 domain-containing protein [Campylobacter sp. US33a]
MLRFLLIVSIFLSFVYAKSYEEVFDEYYTLSGGRAMLEKNIDETTISQMLDSMIAQENWQLDEVQKQKVKNILQKYIKQVVEDVNKEIVEIHKKYFTQKDLEDLNKFYKTSIGKKSAKNAVLMQDDLQNLTVKIMTKYIFNMQEDLSRELGNLNQE